MTMRKNFLFLVFLTVLSILTVFPGGALADSSLEPYLLPWEYDSVSEMAEADGELHFFFMASEGYVVSPGSSTSEPEKWGDSCLVVFPNGQLMLIDAGMPNYAPVLIENLHRLGVEKLDYLMISHPHDDHAGSVYAANGLPDHIEIGQAFVNGTYNGDWSEPKRLERVFEEHSIPWQAVSEGFTMDIGEVHLQVISPSPDIVGETLYTTPDVNNSSIVLRMDYKEFSALFTGDIYLVKEWDLTKNKADLLDVDLLKMPHHGNSTTSNSKDFALAVSPALVVGTGHMAIESMTYYYYTKQGAKVLFDYCDGYIHAFTDGIELNWEHSRERATDYYDKFEYENLKGK